MGKQEKIDKEQKELALISRFEEVLLSFYDKATEHKLVRSDLQGFSTVKAKEILDIAKDNKKLL